MVSLDDVSPHSMLSSLAAIAALSSFTLELEMRRLVRWLQTHQLQNDHVFLQDLHVKQKRKFMGPFKKMKRFFRSRIRTKSKEECVTGVGLKSKSTTDMLGPLTDEDTDEEAEYHRKRNLSMSADSVFTPGAPDRSRSSTIPVGRPNMARSMETVPQPGFTHELFRKIKNRRGGEEDEGLPKSPSDTASAEVIENGLKKSRSESDSLGSVESLEEMDDDFFQSSWSAVAGTKRAEPAGEDRDYSSYDLDMIGSSSSLVSSSIRHKLAVKPPGKRASSKHRPRKVPSPLPVPDTVPEVEEEALPSPVTEEPTVNISKDFSAETSIQVVADVEPAPPPEPEPELEPEPEAEPAMEEVTPEVVEEEPKEEVKEIKLAVVEKPATPPPSEDKSEKAEEDGKVFGGVVLRRTGKLAQIQDNGTLRKPNARLDLSKRQTIAGDSNLFGNRKVDVKEPVAKDDSHKPSTVAEEEEPNTEFTAMFNRLRKQSSQKRILLEKEDKRPTPGSKILRKTSETKPAQSAAPKPVITAAKPTISAAKPAEKSSPASNPPTAENSPRNSTEKATVESKASITLEKKVEKAPSFKEKTVETKPAVVIEKKPAAVVIEKKSSPVVIEKKSPPVVTEKKSVVLEKKTVSKVAEENKDSIEKKEAEKKTVVIEKPSVLPVKTPVEKKPSNTEKPSPLNKKPEAEKKVETPDNSSEKKTTNSPAKENSLSTPTSNSVRSPVLRRVEQRKPAPQEKSNGDEPAWFAMARRKTRDWDQKEKELEQKDRKDSSNMAVKRDMIIDGKEDENVTVEHRRHSRVLDLISNFQNPAVGLSN